MAQAPFTSRVHQLFTQLFADPLGGTSEIFPVAAREDDQGPLEFVAYGSAAAAKFGAVDRFEDVSVRYFENRRRRKSFMASILF
jgi:hypothetical protein